MREGGIGSELGANGSCPAKLDIDWAVQAEVVNGPDDEVAVFFLRPILRQLTIHDPELYTSRLEKVVSDVCARIPLRSQVLT